MAHKRWTVRGDESVWWAQQNLYWLNFNPESNIDGVAGKITTFALKAFQDRTGIETTGKLDAKTVQRLIDRVKVYQEGVGTTADGQAGPNTMESTKSYQGKMGLQKDGICGVATRWAIRNKQKNTYLTDGDKWTQFRRLALAQVGDRYVFAAETTPGKDSDKWDCSELVEWLFETVFGGNYPDGTLYQWNASKPVIGQDVMRAGTIGFLRDTYRPGISHVAVVIGNGDMVNAKGTKYGVIRTNVGAFQSSRKFAGWRRFR